MRQKSFERKSWYRLPIHRNFRRKNFSEKWRAPLRNFLVLWENHYSTKLWYTISCNFFNPDFFLKHQISPTNYSVTVRQKSSERMSWYLTSIHKNFRRKNFSEKWRVSLRNFSVLKEDHYSTKSWYTILCNFVIQKFSETKGSSYEQFRYCETRKFREKIVISPS